jgi:DNA-binding NarL/FixJ family response regulator
MVDAAMTGRSRELRVLVATRRLTDRERIVRILDRAGGFAVVGETSDGSAAVRLSGRVEPDLVLLDMGLPTVNAIDATAAIVHAAPGVTVVLLTPEDGSEAGAGLAARFGARGQVRIDSADAVIVAAMMAAMPRELAGRDSRPQQAGVAPPPWWEALSADG